MSSGLKTQWWGRVAYLEAQERQLTLRDAVIAGEAPGTFVFVEHSPVVTAGRHESGAELDRGVLERHRVDFAQSTRGGKLTYHGPGQLVLYPIVPLSTLGLGVHDFVMGLSNGIGAWLSSRGLEPWWREEAPGVWVCPEEPKKIASVGLRIARGVTMHGAAVNLTTDLTHFSLLRPCGFQGSVMTSLERETGEHCSVLDAAKEVLPYLEETLSVRISSAGLSGTTVPSCD